MRVAIMSDIHGNLEAFKAVLEDIKMQGITKMFITGDVVGYGANPNECLQLVKDLNINCVKGNHDEVAVSGDSSWFNAAASVAIQWVSKELTEDNKELINYFPYKINFDDFVLAHGTPNEPEKYGYIHGNFEASKNIYNQKLCFIGHTHSPFIHQADAEYIPDVESFKIDGSVSIQLEDKNYIVNVGSVGQPRDYNPLACYVVYDTETKVVEFNRITYDIETASQKIIDAGLPPRLGWRLQTGE